MLGETSYSTVTALRVYRIWVRDGRLVGLPAKRSRRLPLLDLVAQSFEPGQAYSAREVEAALAGWHSDTAALGRYLVDEGFLDRLPDGSRWWRCGGTVDLDVERAKSVGADGDDVLEVEDDIGVVDDQPGAGLDA